MSEELMTIADIKKQYESERTQEASVIHVSEYMPVPSAAENTVNEIMGQAVIHQMSNNNTKARALKAADKVINTHISKIENQAEQGEKEAVFANNKDACDLYGIDEKTVPKWVVGVARLVQNF